jgi:hypothetical protein|tara:strand:+ start:19910 stop:20278 length:369 start_codon:yes stop_codon:yes gene_type:complete
MSDSTKEQALSVYDIVISAEFNSICPQGLLGIILHQEYNDFARKTASVIVFENLQFADFLESDLGSAFIRTEYNTGEILKGIAFNNDNDITRAIKSGVLKRVFERIRQNLSDAEAKNATTPS